MPIKTSYDPKSGCYVASDGQQYATGDSYANARSNLVREMSTTHRFKLRNDANNVPVKFVTPMRHRTVCDQSLAASDYANRKVFSQPLTGGYWNV